MNVAFTWNEETIGRAASLWNDGKSLTQIGRDFGVTRSAVAAMIYRNRHKFPQRGSGNRRPRASSSKPIFRWTPEALERASQLWKAGTKAAEIAAEMGVAERPFLSMINRYRTLFPARHKVDRSKPRRAAEESREFAPPQAGAERRGLDLSLYQIAGTTPVPFALLSSRQCHFPLEAVEAVSGPDTPCCGQPCAETYCTTHKKIMYEPRATTRRLMR